MSTVDESRSNGRTKATLAAVSVLNVPGIDRRRLNKDVMPFLADLIDSGTLVEWDGHPTTEIWPTLVTGANPHKHLIWHCKLNDQGPAVKWSDRVLEMLPDRVVSTLQLFRHFIDSEFDMPCIPHWRRRHLEFHRLKFNARSNPEQYGKVGGIDTIFAALGEKAAYGVTGEFEQFDEVLENWPRQDTVLDWFEIHAYDIASHYNVERDDVMKKRGRQLDDFAKAYHDKCVAARRRFILVVDHGQEPVVGSVNLQKVLKETRVNSSEYVYFTAQGVAKFWFRTKAARVAIESALRKTQYVNILDWQELNKKFGFEFTKDWGELYVIADNGRVFFPHDFHHLFAHFYLGLLNPAMRSRLWNFNVSAYHGQMPNHPSEFGFMVTKDPSIRSALQANKLIQIIDVAPTLLSLVGSAALPHMVGKKVFESTNGN